MLRNGNVINVVDGCTNMKKKVPLGLMAFQTKARSLLGYIQGNLIDSEVEFISSDARFCRIKAVQAFVLSR
jgi:hypothetical protein